MTQSVRRISIAAALAALLAAIFAAPASATPERDRYIVVLEDTVDGPGDLARAQLEQHNGELGFVYRHALKGYSAALPEPAVEALERDPRVKYISLDGRVVPFEEEELIETLDNEGVELLEHTVPTGIDRTFATQNEALAINGEDDLRADVDVAVIDTGIDQNHPDLDVVGRTDCTQGGESCLDNSGTDGHSHGTHVAGTIGAIDNAEGVVGVAPGARLWAVKVLSNSGSGSWSWVIAGVDWVTAHASEIEVANMSLGGFGSQPALDEAIENSVKAGVVHVVAAGNSNANAEEFSPARSEHVIAVSALTDYDGKPGGEGSPSCANYGLDDRKASFSNYGAAIEIAAPGVCTLSTEPGNKYGRKSGTSMASPHVAGAAALLAGRDDPENKEDVEAIGETLFGDRSCPTGIGQGNCNWTDTSGDGIQEPLLDVGDESIFALAGPPEATTEPATNIKTTEATLNATVNPSGLATTYQFEYGTTIEYGSKVPAEPKSIGSGTSDVEVSEAISGLSPETTYHFRIVAENSEGTTFGEDRSFTTLAVTPQHRYYIWGGQGTGEGEFATSEGIATDMSGNVWVSDRSLNRIQKFTEGGEHLLQFGAEGSGNGQFKQPRGVATTPGGDLWVVDSGNDRLQRFNSEGEYLGQFGTSGSGNGQFNNPWGIAIASDGSIWISDTANDNIQKFTSSGEFILKSGSLGSGDGQFSNPQGIDTDSAGNLWIADSGNNRMQKLSAIGAFLSKFGSKGSSDGQFAENGPVDVAVKPSGTLLVADGWDNHRVQHLAPDGQWLAKASEWSPKTLALGRGGKFFVFQGSSRLIRVWSQPEKPEATTEPATNIKTTEATLNATVNPSGLATTYQFEYGTTIEYGSKVPAEPKSIGSGTSDVEVSEAISGLSPETTYHFRIVAENSEGTTFGEDRSFTTSP